MNGYYKYFTLLVRASTLDIRLWHHICLESWKHIYLHFDCHLQVIFQIISRGQFSITGVKRGKGVGGSIPRTNT